MNSDAIFHLLIIVIFLAIGLHSLWLAFQIGVRNRPELVVAKEQREAKREILPSIKGRATLLCVVSGLLGIAAFVLIGSIQAPLPAILRISAPMMMLVAMPRRILIPYYVNKATSARSKS